VAVLVDATIVRALLLPAVLALLGPRAWWGPKRWQRQNGQNGRRRRRRGPIASLEP
jgi:RND superfamily putative drug exporter